LSCRLVVVVVEKEIKKLKKNPNISLFSSLLFFMLFVSGGYARLPPILIIALVIGDTHILIIIIINFPLMSRFLTIFGKYLDASPAQDLSFLV